MGWQRPWVSGSGFEVRGLGLGVSGEDFRFRVTNFLVTFGVTGFGFRSRVRVRVSGFVFHVSGFGSQISGFGFQNFWQGVLGRRSGVWGDCVGFRNLGFRVRVAEFGVSSLGFDVTGVDLGVDLRVEVLDTVGGRH